MTAERPGEFTSRVKLGAIILAGLLLIIFIALNFEDVDIEFVIATVTVPLALGLIITAVLGFLIGYFAPRRH